MTNQTYLSGGHWQSTDHNRPEYATKGLKIIGFLFQNRKKTTKSKGDKPGFYQVSGSIQVGSRANCVHTISNNTEKPLTVRIPLIPGRCVYIVFSFWCKSWTTKGMPTRVIYEEYYRKTLGITTILDEELRRFDSTTPLKHGMYWFWLHQPMLWHHHLLLLLLGKSSSFKVVFPPFTSSPEFVEQNTNGRRRYVDFVHMDTPVV